jgi:ketosteroid isomerase-like protein
MSDSPPFEVILKAKDNAFNETAKMNRQALFDAYKAMLKGDEDALNRLLDDNLLFVEAAGLPYGGEFHGIEGSKKGVAGMFGAWSHLHVEIEDFLASGDLVIAYMTMVATSRKTGKVYDGYTAELFRFKNGKIIEWRPIYWDTHAVRVACGLA